LAQLPHGLRSTGEIQIHAKTVKVIHFFQFAFALFFQGIIEKFHEVVSVVFQRTGERIFQAEPGFTGFLFGNKISVQGSFLFVEISRVIAGSSLAR
jgi:hypothetical protein